MFTIFGVVLSPEISTVSHVLNTEEHHTIVLVLILKSNADRKPLLSRTTNEIIQMLITADFAHIFLIHNEPETPLIFGESSSEFGFGDHSLLDNLG